MTGTDHLLAQIAATLDGARSARRRLLDEIREDIYDAVQAERGRGLDTAAAEAVVIARFGSPLALAASWNRDHAKRRRAVRRNVALVLVAVATAATLGVTQHASGKSPPNRTSCVHIRLTPGCRPSGREPSTTTEHPHRSLKPRQSKKPIPRRRAAHHDQ